MNTYLKLLGAVAATSILTSCGGSGSDGDVVYTSFGTITSEEAVLLSKYDGDLATPTLAADLPLGEPNGGSATYQGFLTGRLEGRAADVDQFAGQLTLAVDFTSSTVSEARAYNFLREDSTEIDGELTLDSSLILPSGGPSGEADISAVLTGPLDTVQSTVSLDGSFIAGDQAIFGTAIGSVAGDKITIGNFIAER